MAAKDGTNASDIDKTSFWMAGLCNICHPGGSYAEYDRDGELYYDIATGEFGYEKLGLNSSDVEFDGDYSEVITSGASSGDIRLAPWDVTGMAEADCLLCHRVERTINSPAPGQYMNMNWIWHAAVLRKKDALVDAAAGDPVEAFAAASTASQGWGTVALGSPPAGKPPIADTFDIDYTLGTADGSLVEQSDGTMKINAGSIQGSPSDWACWGCHVIADDKKRGRVWFDPDEDVHYAGINNVTSSSSDAELETARNTSTACTYCHPVTGNMSDLDREHNIAKGNANLGTVRDDTDYVEFNTCRDCHVDGADPAAPPPPGGTMHMSGHLDVMSCEFCHIPYKNDNASLAIDNATKGSTINYNTEKFLTPDPLVTTTPSAGQAPGRWYSSATMKQDDTGTRLYPDKLLLSCWLGDYNMTDDVVAPTPLWRIRDEVSGGSWPVFTDDNADSLLEINSLTEIQAVLVYMRDNDDQYGVPLAVNPAYVKGELVFYLDAGTDNVLSFHIHGSGVLVEASHPFSINHNVLDPSSADMPGCSDCHTSDPVATPAPFFDRYVLVDPFGESGAPEFKTLRELLEERDPGNGLDPD